MLFFGNRNPKAEVEPDRRPKHIAVIMDGNGRWAQSRGLPRTAGHKKGADSLRTLLRSCRDAHIPYLTVYAFSSENWKRSSEEINDLMQLLKHYLDNELNELNRNKIRLRFIGDISKLNEDIRTRVEQATQLTRHHRDFTLTIALSYGSREELVRSVQKIAQEVQEGKIRPGDITEHTITQSLDTAQTPEPDLLIRTGGEQRLSNFLLWQSAYTEFYFTDTLWPDFSQDHFDDALDEFAQRERRYGTAE